MNKASEIFGLLNVEQLFGLIWASFLQIVKIKVNVLYKKYFKKAYIPRLYPNKILIRPYNYTNWIRVSNHSSLSEVLIRGPDQRSWSGVPIRVPDQRPWSEVPITDPDQSSWSEVPTEVAIRGPDQRSRSEFPIRVPDQGYSLSNG